MRLPEPVLVLDLFPEERAALLDLLSSLTEDEWARPTACPGWSVKDIAGHILGVDFRNLSWRRDGFQGGGPAPGEDLAAFVDHINEEWVRAARRLSPRVLQDLLAASGLPLSDYLASLDLFAVAEPVSWAGPEPAPVWLDVAREYTERWVHQQQIRDAVGQPGLADRRFLAPVLATFAHALPVALRHMDAPRGTTVLLYIDGDSGGEWSIMRAEDVWTLRAGGPAASDAHVVLDEAVAWCLFSKGLDPEETERQVTYDGDQSLGVRVLHAVAIVG